MRQLMRNQGGSHMVELVAIMPMVLMIVLIIWQFFVAGHALVVAEATARDAARAASVGGDPQATAERVAAGYDPTVTGPDVARVPGIGCTVAVTVTIRVPIVVLRSAVTLPITRKAVMPQEAGGC